MKTAEPTRFDASGARSQTRVERARLICILLSIEGIAQRRWWHDFGHEGNNAAEV